jgi:hypothetical protein
MEVRGATGRGRRHKWTLWQGAARRVQQGGDGSSRSGEAKAEGESEVEAQYKMPLPSVSLVATAVARARVRALVMVGRVRVRVVDPEMVHGCFSQYQLVLSSSTMVT